METPELAKFTRKVTRILEDHIRDKRARAQRKRIADPERRFQEGMAEGLGRAISIMKSLSKEW